MDNIAERTFQELDKIDLNNQSGGCDKKEFSNVMSIVIAIIIFFLMLSIFNSILRSSPIDDYNYYNQQDIYYDPRSGMYYMV